MNESRAANLLRPTTGKEALVCGVLSDIRRIAFLRYVSRIRVLVLYVLRDGRIASRSFCRTLSRRDGRHLRMTHSHALIVGGTVGQIIEGYNRAWSVSNGKVSVKWTMEGSNEEPNIEIFVVRGRSA